MFLRKARPAGFTEEERAAFLAATPCVLCGGWHPHECWRAKRIRFDAGKIVEAKYFRKWDRSTTVFPQDLEQDPYVSVWQRKVLPFMKARWKTLKDKALDSLWTVSYFSWASRVVAVAVTFAITATLVIGMLSLVVHLANALL